MSALFVCPLHVHNRRGAHCAPGKPLNVALCGRTLFAPTVKSNINYNSQVPSVITCKRVARHGYPPGDPLLPYGQFTLCRACAVLPVCVAVRYLTLRTGYERHGRKNPLPFPMSKRSHVGNLRQIRKQGKGRSSKRKGNRRCPFLFAPAAGAATSRRPQTANPHR